jgi:hypothetical protein
VQVVEDLCGYWQGYSVLYVWWFTLQHANSVDALLLIFQEYARELFELVLSTICYQFVSAGRCENLKCNSLILVPVPEAADLVPGQRPRPRTCTVHHSARIAAWNSSCRANPHERNSSSPASSIHPKDKSWILIIMGAQGERKEPDEALDGKLIRCCN